ncbi:DUF2147 domain-containing protein [Pedobacter yulinensis]|uniref:DUF2147 domain-containing protein n=1 Tax=Pedobacter yulinensis TaxID=2126353 RepID=A0A2T3HM12_9SPHI|nr:DUF2147 domain-containing protein [Pedobacter yulinensis]PST83492.1 DUF2147 domain-containing protein [Pedobacter yulinensis]
MNKFFACLLLITSVSLGAFAQNKDAIIGRWLNPSGEGQIEIYKRGTKYFGKLAWMKEPNENGKPKLDAKNPDAKLRSRQLLNLEILRDFEFEDGEWTNGKIYDPKSGKTYSCNISLKGQDKMSVRGYIGISLIGRSETFTRVK